MINALGNDIYMVAREVYNQLRRTGRSEGLQQACTELGQLFARSNVKAKARRPAAGGDALPAAWLEQLAVGGRLVSPVRQPGSGKQMLVVVDRNEQGHVHRIHEAVNFVPLKSGLIG